MQCINTEDDNDSDIIVTCYIKCRCVGTFRYFPAGLAILAHGCKTNHLPLTAVGSNPVIDFGFKHMSELSS
jgi:hypothetical protein